VSVKANSPNGFKASTSCNSIMDLTNLLSAAALSLDTIGVYVLLLNAGVWQDLVKYNSRVHRWLFKLRGEYSYLFALSLIVAGTGMQTAAFLLD